MSVERTRSAAETEALGERLASTLEPGDVVLVAGELGAGKTTLIRGACRALGVEGPIQSPTFTIGRRHSGRVAVSHLDLFRLERLEGEEPGLLDDYLTADAVAFVEWPRGAGGGIELGDVAAGRLIRIELRHAGTDEREVEISP
ncbi:MAG TPA: tRNA (adenosine(37)-N6)-threonylcarbamoyltransferase complex ATPase subunit type 1 TsaE [Solirubrobacterales bacterium]|nr:tRNA (adenosine(37)-N6)-threonylcarbamoyltransferase complex ATPase subunit type 1 TsaE [Solirubrobacterales bacterium]